MSEENPRVGTEANDLLTRLGHGVEMLRGSRIELENYRPAEHGDLVSFEGLPGYEEIDRYWLNAPFAYASINYDPEENEHHYHVVEPELSPHTTSCSARCSMTFTRRCCTNGSWRARPRRCSRGSSGTGSRTTAST
jgi:hypothetical protein